MKKSITKRTCLILFVAIFIILLLSLFSAISTLSQITFTFTGDHGQPKTPTAVTPVVPEIKPSSSEHQFQVEIAYAYVGPLPSDKFSYYSGVFNETMIHASKYPSAVLLNLTRLPSNQLNFCDAIVEVYRVKVATDTGQAEYYAWSAGTNCTAIAQEDFSTLIRSSDNLIDRNLYQSVGGTFIYDWTVNRSVLSHAVGSAGRYTNSHTQNVLNISDFSSLGIPTTITVEVRRLGYVTMTNSSVAICEDEVTLNKPVSYVKLSKYGDGFIYNTIVPTEKLPHIDLFHPID